MNIETSLDHLGQLHIDADLADEHSPDGRGDYAVLAYVPEYDEYEISDPFNGSWDVGDDCWQAIDTFCSFYNVSYKDREQIQRTFARLLRDGANSNRSRKITSSMSSNDIIKLDSLNRYNSQTRNKSYSGRYFVVVDKDTGIPISGQGYGADGLEYGTIQECVERLDREVEECHRCGLDEITDRDFQIRDIRDGEIIL